MLVEAIIISIICGFLLNKGQKNFDSISVKGVYIVFASALIEIGSQYLLTFNLFGYAQMVTSATLIIEIVTYILLFLFIYQNRDKKGIKIILFGALLNAIAIVSNNGYMMVDGQILLDMGFLNSYNELRDGFVFAHALVDIDTKFVFLADIINIVPPYPFPKSISIGDLILDLGVFIVVINVFKESVVGYKKT